MSVPQRMVHKRRATITALPLYYSGHLLKKFIGEKDFKKYYAELRGCTIFLYNNDTEVTYAETLDLQTFKSMPVVLPYKQKTAVIFTLTLRNEEVQLKIENPDRAEEWRGYILTVAKKEVPSQLQLLPGQILKLEEVLIEETKRLAVLPARPTPPPRPAFLSPPSTSASAPSPQDSGCFYSVTRQEAEQMLEERPDNGSIILRPSTQGKHYALTFRQAGPSGNVMKNYKLTKVDKGFIIELDTPVTVPSLSAVVKYFIEKTEHRLTPYIKTHPYDTRIELPPAPESPSPTSKPSKSVPWAEVTPMVHKRTKGDKQATETVENEYLVPDSDAKQGRQPTKMDEQLRDVLQQRRQKLFTGGD